VSLFEIVLNIFEVLPRDIARLNTDSLTQAVLITGFFYLISRWFKAYTLRMILFIVGGLILLRVFQGESFLNRFDFYAGLGILLPHIEIASLTIFILKEKSLALWWTISSPFVWMYAKLETLKSSKRSEYKEEYYQKESETKRKRRTHGKTYQRKEENFYEEQAKRETEQERATREYQEKLKRQAEKEKQQTHSRWDSTDEYIVLGIDKGATFKQIKSKYRKLAQMYHPDYTLTKKEEHTIIFQKINSAYTKLEKKLAKK